MALNDPIARPIRIADVERATGLSKDVLRMWERRYGFPVPLRDGQGRRCYSPAQVERLRLLRALIDLGDRPAELMHQSDTALAARIETHSAAPAGAAAGPPSPVAEALAHLAADRPGALDLLFERHLLEFGLRHFLVALAAPLTTAAGEAWAAGQLTIHQEHVFSDRLLRFLGDATARWCRAAGEAEVRGPRVMLMTLSGEAHRIGLAMVAAWISLEGGTCIELGTELPVEEIAAAAVAHRADIVALSFSSHFQSARAHTDLAALVEMLPAACSVWIGGGESARWELRSERIRQFTSIEALGPAITAWRGARRPA